MWHLSLLMRVRALSFVMLRTIVGLAWLAWLSVGASPTFAAAPIFWTGPIFTYQHTNNSTDADLITTNHVGADATNNVWITRGTSMPLYNAAAETQWDQTISPANTLWIPASGALTNADQLTNYDTFANVVGSPGNSPGNQVNQTFFVKIVTDNIYFSLTLTEWGNADGGSFAYDRSTPGSVAPPTPNATVTSPASGAVYAAPANVHIVASTNGSSVVTNMHFFANNVSLGSVAVAPFSITASNFAAGPYSLTAVATASGISATSPAVNITVVNPVPVVISGVRVITNQINFDYTANIGLSYFIQRSSNFVDWTSFPTNMAIGSPVSFSSSLPLANFKFYRVGRVPNP